MTSRIAYVALVLLACTTNIFLTELWAAELSDPAFEYKLTYPDDWHALPIGNVLFLATVPRFDPGGVLPEGAAYINVQVRDPKDTADMVLDSLAPFPGARSHEQFDNIEGEQLLQTFSLGGSLPEQTRLAMVTRIAGKQLLFILRYYKDDPKADTYKAILRQVISSVTVASAVTK